MSEINPKIPIPMNIIRKRYLKSFFSESVRIEFRTSLTIYRWCILRSSWPSLQCFWIRSQQQSKSKAQLSSKYIVWFSFNMSLSYLREYFYHRTRINCIYQFQSILVKRSLLNLFLRKPAHVQTKILPRIFRRCS